MNGDNMIGDADRQAQALQSEAPATAAELNLPAGTVAEPTRQDPGAVHFDDVVDQGIDEEDEFSPRTFQTILNEAAGVEGMLRLAIRPELNFVVNLFNDEVHEMLVDTANFSHADQKLNLIQPLSKLNDRSQRIGVLREPLRNFVNTLQGVMGNDERIVVTTGTATLIVNNLVEEFVRTASHTLFSNFPHVDGVPVLYLGGEGEEPTLVRAEEYVRVTSLTSIERLQGDADTLPSVVVTVKFIVHLRIPLLIREQSDKFERTLKTHFKYLETCGVKAGMPCAVYVAFNTPDLVHQPVLDSFNWIRTNDPEVEVLSFRNTVDGGQFIGAPGFAEEDYADALFNGGDFLVAFSLEKEGE